MSWTPTRAVTFTAAAALVLAGSLAGCSSGRPSSSPTSPSSSSSPSTTPSPTPAAAPPAHACYALSFTEAAEPTTAKAPVPCTAPHTTETIRVGTIQPVVDGHLLAVDSDTVQQQVANRCRAALAAHLGGDEEAQRLSRFTVVWFTPSLVESDLGALWFRCDLLGLAGHDQLATLPRSTAHVLDGASALDRFGTCGTAAPSDQQFQRVMCSRPHSWRARSTIDLPGPKYPDKSAVAAADAGCHDVEAKLASNSLKLRWSFESPTRAQWRAGQHYGFCWTPDPA